MYLQSTSNSSWKWSYVESNSGYLSSSIFIAKPYSLWHGSLSACTLLNTSEKSEYFSGKTVELGFSMTLFEVIIILINALIVAFISYFSLIMFFKFFQSTIKASRLLASQTVASSSKPTTAMSGGCVSAELQLLLHLALTFGFWTFFGLVVIKSLPSGSGKVRFSFFYLIIGFAACN